ncbi:MAG: hypothetical protein K0M78_07630, partial [Brevundimonas sp.]|nr:hypothetical protein [Brevundimonas sp.]
GLAGCLGLAACYIFATGRVLRPPPGRPVPPSPDLPMTAPKARLIMGTLSGTCIELASLKYAIHDCELKQGRPADDEVLRTELRDLRWNLDKLTPDEASAQCAALTEDLRKTPKPAVCW